MFRRLYQFGLPSAIGACWAALVASLAETTLNTASPVDALAGAGFLLMIALPIGIVVSLLGRSLFASWKFSSWIEEQSSQRGSAPRFAAWTIFVVAALVVQCWATFNGLRLLFSATRVSTLVALATPLMVLGVSLVLLVLSHPFVATVERWLVKLEERRAEGEKSPACTARNVLVTLLVCAMGAFVLTWLVFLRSRLAHLDLGFVGYLLLYLLGLAFAPGLWQRLKGIRSLSRALSIAPPPMIFLCISLSLWMRYTRPYQMLEIWGETRLAGWAIDTNFDVQGMRADLPIEGIKPKAKRGVSHANVVIISIDTLRADQLSFHSGKAETLTLAALAREGIIFDRAYAPGNVTRRSLPTMATGLSPRRVRGRVVGRALRLDPRHILLAERFRAAGYDTAGFFCCAAHFGPEHKLGLNRGMDIVRTEYQGDLLAEQTVNWLAEGRDSKKPLFLWTHYIEPHDWAKTYKSEDGRSSYIERYGESLKTTDRYLGTLIAGIRESLGDDTYIVLTSDHGEGLGDHGVQFHSAGLYNTELRVPLLISGPGIKAGRMQQAVGLVDLAPTLLELAGYEAPGMPAMDGLSLAPELFGLRKDALGMGEAYSVMITDRSVLEDQAALISGRYKLVERPGSSYRLFDMNKDPKEQKDIKEEAPELLRSMKARLRRRQRLDAISAF